MKGPRFDLQYCLFQNLCSKFVNCHHLTTPSYNQHQNFWYGATSVFEWCVLQDLKHLNFDPLWHYSRKKSLPSVASWWSKVLWYVESLPGVECVMLSLNSRQVADSRRCKTPYSSVEKHSPCLWKVRHSIVDKQQTLEASRHRIAQWKSIHHVCERSRVWWPVLSLSKFMFKTCQLPPSNHLLI